MSNYASCSSAGGGDCDILGGILVHATIRQIEYYKDTKLFASDAELATVYACLQKMVDHRLNDSRMVVLNDAVLNTIRTTDAYFTQCTDEHFQNIVRKSALISGVGEKERSKFFNALREKIEDTRKS